VRRWVNENLGGLPRAFWHLWVGTLINRLGNFTILYLEINLVARYHVSASFAGLVIGLTGAGQAAGSLVGGVLADRWGRRPTMISANLASVVATLALGATLKPGLIAVLAGVYGVFNGLARPAFSAMLVDVLGDRQRIRGFNLNYWAINLGFAGASILAGMLANTPRMTLFTLDALATAVSGLWIFIRVRESAPSAATRAVSPAGRGGLGRVLLDGPFMLFVALNLGAWTVVSTVGLMPITMLHGGLHTSSYGAILAVNGIVITVGQLFVPRLIRGRSRTHVLALSSILIAVGFGAVAFAPTVLLLGATVLIWTLGEMSAAPSNSSLIADLADPTMRGRYQGVASLSYSVSGFVAPIVGGFAIDHFGDKSLWLGGFALGLLVALGHLLTGPGRERRVASLRAAASARAMDTPELVSA
jgi:MFS family permease